MSYMEISNLYKAKEILLFRECFAAEKIHGTSTHITWKDGQLSFFAGGCKHEAFVALFDQVALVAKFTELGFNECTVFGEGYGGKEQGMRATYGNELRFVAFEVRMGEHCWLSVDKAEAVVLSLGLEFVSYVRIPTDLAAIDAERDKPSEMAFRRGCAVREDPTTWKIREGVVLRPIIEVRKNNNERVISKHKRDEFAERKHVPKVTDPDKLKILTDAEEIATEWVTESRLKNAQSHFQESQWNMQGIPIIMRYLNDDIQREAGGEIVFSKEASRAIGRRAVKLFKKMIACDDFSCHNINHE